MLRNKKRGRTYRNVVFREGLEFPIKKMHDDHDDDDGDHNDL